MKTIAITIVPTLSCHRYEIHIDGEFADETIGSEGSVCWVPLYWESDSDNDRDSYDVKLRFSESGNVSWELTRTDFSVDPNSPWMVECTSADFEGNPVDGWTKRQFTIKANTPDEFIVGDVIWI